MAVEVAKIDSNVTGLRYAKEYGGNPLGKGLGHLPDAVVDPPTDNSAIWEPMEPNSYADFGGQVVTVARNPINPSRQRKKGVTTDLDASGGINSDWTQLNMQDPLQGFFFADIRRKGDLLDENNIHLGDEGFASLDGATVTTDVFTISNLKCLTVTIVAAGTGYIVGEILTLTTGTTPVATAACTLRVNAIDGSGGVTAASILKHGVYSVAPTAAGATTSNAAGTGSTVTVTTGVIGDFKAQDMIWVQGMVNAGNNGIHIVTTYAGGTDLIVLGSTLVTEAAVPAGATLTRIGVEGATGNIDVDVTGTWPKFVATGIDWTALGVVPGEWIFVGGDAGINAFTNAVNNGWKRVRSVSATDLEIDKSESAMVVEADTTQSVRVFTGRVLKNETGTLIKRRTYTLERQLGVPNPTSAPTEVQAEYLRGAVPNEITINVPQADKLNIDLSWVATKHQTVDGPTTLWSSHAAANAPAIIESDAFNTSSDFSRIKLATVISGSEAPDPLFAFATELSVAVNNNVTANKAVGVLGAFDATAGTFEVGGSITAYFADVAAIASVQNNADITLDIIMVKANAGISVDMPLITLGDGRANIEQDTAITLPLETAAATGAKNNPLADHTLLLGFYTYLPNAADV